MTSIPSLVLNQALKGAGMGGCFLIHNGLQAAPWLPSPGWFITFHRHMEGTGTAGFLLLHLPFQLPSAALSIFPH